MILARWQCPECDWFEKTVISSRDASSDLVQFAYEQLEEEVEVHEFVFHNIDMPGRNLRRLK